MTKPKVDPLAEEVGINAVATIFTSDFKWAFRRQTTLNWGTDVYVEVIENGELTGKLIALQIKSGTSYFRHKANGDYVYYGEERHLRYWLNHALPVFIILHNPVDKFAIWQKIELDKVIERKSGRWSINVPAANVLASKFKHCFEAGIPSDDNAYRRFMLTIDYPFISLCLEKEKEGIVTMRVIDYINKTWNIRSAYVYWFGNDRTDADYAFMHGMPQVTVAEFMAIRFPWLDYVDAEDPQETDGEFVDHILEISVNSLGRAVVEYETYIVEGVQQENFGPGISMG